VERFATDSPSTNPEYVAPTALGFSPEVDVVEDAVTTRCARVIVATPGT
jgi:hypothetical protein